MTLRKLNELIFVNQSQHADNIEMDLMFLLLHNNFKIAGLGILSFAPLLILLKSNERPWANHSGRSEEMSDREQIAQVAQDKWATMSNSLRSLRENERFAQKMLTKKI